MNAFDKKIEMYHKIMKDLSIPCDIDKLIACTLACGPSIYNPDGELVSSSDINELNTVKIRYLIQKLGLSNHEHLNEILDYAIEKFGKSNRRKYRAIFYYLCSQKANVFPL